jgi:fatty acid synthase
MYFIDHLLLVSRYFRAKQTKVVICRFNLSTKFGCEEIINEALKLGPIDGIFNLAIVARDGLFENLTPEMFEDVLTPKAHIAQNLHEISMKLCPDLRHFVVFSSVSCSQGNPGQCNYGLSNSIMERIVEKRKLIGLPGKAIQWGTNVFYYIFVEKNND